MAYPYFPIALQQLGATMRYLRSSSVPFRSVTSASPPGILNHPALTLGYRLDTGAATVRLTRLITSLTCPIKPEVAHLPGRVSELANAP